MRSFAGQPKAIARPCFACKKGLNGRKYCPTCGNTNDYGDVPSSFFKDKPLDEQPRTSKEITQAMSQSLKLERGLTYRVTVEISPERFKTFVATCLWAQGPFAHFDNGYDVNTLEIKECSVV